MCPSLVNLRISSLRTFPFCTSSSIVSSVFLLQILYDFVCLLRSVTSREWD
ncbi:uncharacterized protein RAG0_12989 [Rhynchosporium agropyri]|uniref:Uncharacterized protein n=1 Tax=Rhynchosporium agropyri TaxID=914238 RepID=A0A1E1LAS2_9HELO|nr:uncharacterized protein RAG0_12989 [Rhynchosporium agropyri]